MQHIGTRMSYMFYMSYMSYTIQAKLRLLTAIRELK
jgi:hypothetical protein